MFRRGWTLAGLAALLLIFAFPAAQASPPIQPQWVAAQAPFRIAGNLYYIGTEDIAVYLVATRDGLIVLDGGLEEPSRRSWPISASWVSIRRGSRSCSTATLTMTTPPAWPA